MTPFDGVTGLFYYIDCIFRTAVIVTYYVIILNAANLGGNPFLDYFFQAIVEIPAYLLARYFCDKYGRRITQISAFLCSALTCIPFIIIIIGKTNYWSRFYLKSVSTELAQIHESNTLIWFLDPSKQVFISALAVLIQFFTSIAFYGSSLIAVEIFPTCVRQSGLSACGIFCTIFSIAVPYIIYLVRSILS